MSAAPIPNSPLIQGEGWGTPPMIRWMNEVGSDLAAIAQYPFIVVSAPYAASLTLDCTNYQAYGTIIFDTPLTGNVTTLTVTGAADGQSIIWRATQDATGSRTWSPDSSVGFSTTIPSVTLTTTPSKVDYIAMRWCSAANKAHVTAYNLGF